MKNKIILGLIAVVAVAGGVAAMSAFEAHIVNVTATIENALGVTPTEMLFGTVFPEEQLYQNLQITLSDSFVAEDRVDDVQYKITQQAKPMPEAQGNYPDLCQFLSMTPDLTPENDGQAVEANHTNPIYASTTGYLSKKDGDVLDAWTIDLDVPCFTGMCADEHPSIDPGLEHAVFGCDLFIEVTGISKQIPLFKELNEPEPDVLGAQEGYLAYNGTGCDLAGTVKVDANATAISDGGHYLLVLNGPRNASVAPGSTNDLLAEWACLKPTSGISNGWDGWWTRDTDNTGVTKCELDSTDIKLEGYYNFTYGITITGAQLKAGYSFNAPLLAGTYSEVQFLVKDLDHDWATVLEYPGVGESNGLTSEFSFTVNQCQ